jgi:hypothetical protein
VWDLEILREKDTHTVRMCEASYVKSPRCNGYMITSEDKMFRVWAVQSRVRTAVMAETPL